MAKGLGKSFDALLEDTEAAYGHAFEHRSAFDYTEEEKANAQEMPLSKISANPNLQIEGVVITMYDGRALISKQITAEIKKFFKNKLYEIIIPRNVRLAEAPSHGLPIMLHDPKCVGARAYKALAEEFLSKQV